MLIFPGSFVASLRIRSMRSSMASAVPHSLSTCGLRLPVDGAAPGVPAAPLDGAPPLADAELGAPPRGPRPPPLVGRPPGGDAEPPVGAGDCAGGVCGASPVGDTG